MTIIADEPPTAVGIGRITPSCQEGVCFWSYL